MDDVTRGEEIKEAVRQAYGRVARRFVGEPAPEKQTSCCDPSPAEAQPARTSCCGPSQAKAQPTQTSCCGPSQAKAQPVQTSCCGPSPAEARPTQTSCCGPSQAKAQPVQTSCCGPSQAEAQPTQASCCGSTAESATCAEGAARFYSGEELAGLPDTVTEASLGCGNPLAIAELKPGEVVLDLGSGGGIDCFLAARKVGPQGSVIGLDMTTDMINLARRNAKKVGVTNVDFRYGEMEDIPLRDESVDVIISNCVINLSPDKDAVFHEAYRVLRPGGRLSVSDVVVDGDLPRVIRERLDVWASCIAGALDEKDYLSKIRAAGFERVEVLSRDWSELSEEGDGQDPTEQQIRALLAEAGLSVHDLSRKVASVKVRAFKPAQACC